MKIVWKVIALLALLAAVAVLVTAPMPVAGAEGLENVPVYAPVTLSGDVTPIDYSEKAPYSPIESAYTADGTGYSDDTLYVKVEEFRAFNTNIQVTWVQVADASQLRSATCSKFPSKNTMNANKLAQRERAVLAINGDYIVYINIGVSARNGVIYRQKYSKNYEYDSLMVDVNGDFTILQNIDEEKVNAYLADHELVHAFTFGPGLVVNGVKNEYYPLKSQVPTHRTQRMGIGQMGPLSYVIVTTEGPDDKDSTGLTLTEFADVFMALGAQNAYNLDGGSSSWLVLNNKRINGTHGSKHRAIADIIYFVTASPDGGAI